jgi:DNA-binding GntR family transcriptional regulator
VNSRRDKVAAGPDSRAATPAAKRARKPLRFGQTSSTHAAYEEIRRRILDNEMPAGAQYLEQELAATLGMSRTPVREALIRLSDEGLVEVRPRHGARVLPISIDDMREIYELLTELEAMAARAAAARGVSDQDLARFDATLDDMEQALARSDLKTWADADRKFHGLLAELSGNKRLQGVIGLFVDQAHRARMLTLALRPRPSRSNADHSAVVAAIRARDPETAYAVHRKHRADAGAMLLDLLHCQGMEAL